MFNIECLNVVISSIKNAIKSNELGSLSVENIPELKVEIPKNRDFGDYAINISSLCRYTKQSPVSTAKTILKSIEPIESSMVETKETDLFLITLAGGYINFKIKKDALYTSLNNSVKEIIFKKSDYAGNNIGNGEKVMIEYVSANPTGPFHIGHGRWAAVGSALANAMKLCGYDVYQEFYVNDAGNQINNLGRSLFIRVLQEKGIDIDFPQNETDAKSFYTGEYLVDCARKFIEDNPDVSVKITKENLEDIDESSHKLLCSYAKAYMLQKQRTLLEKFETHFDNFFMETSLYERGLVQKCLDELKNRGKLYEHEGALWFKSSDYGDEKDRVITKTDGAYTYLTSDIAYHNDKINRGFTKLIDIWGADHHGYIARMKASIEALGNNPDSLVVLLGQLVNLSIKGEQVRMGKRTKMITLEDLIDEVGVDATRFWMIMRDIDNTLEFDVELAKSQTDENPVFYVQYAHARACSILRNAVSDRFDTVNNTQIPAMFKMNEINNYFDNISSESLNVLWQNEKECEEIQKLIEKLVEYKSVVINTAKNYTPYLITKYLRELAATFHKFYAAVRILSDDIELSKAKLALVQSVIIVIKSGLALIGATAPEKM